MEERQFLSKMEEVFIKKYWPEEDVLFYLHFQDGVAVSQIEITEDSKVFLSNKNPLQGVSKLYDQSLEDLELDEGDFISKADFMTIWKEHK